MVSPTKKPNTEKEKTMTNSNPSKTVIILIWLGLAIVGWGLQYAYTPQEATTQRLADIAKDSCHQTVKENEEFSSTVDFPWFGTHLFHGPQSTTYTVTVDYTAKNTMGATLPYVMMCWSDDTGNIVEHRKVGR
jgi:hypothetical protein